MMGFAGMTRIQAAEVTTTPTTTDVIEEEPTDNEIEQMLADVLEEHFGWLITFLGIGSAALAGIIWGIVKTVFWLKRLKFSVDDNAVSESGFKTEMQDV